MMWTSTILTSNPLDLKRRKRRRGEVTKISQDFHIELVLLPKLSGEGLDNLDDLTEALPEEEEAVKDDDDDMDFNDDKFEMMSFSPTARLPLYTTPTGNPIAQKEVIKDLGYQIEDNLTFRTHIATTAAKGHRMAGWALRTFRSRERSLMMTLLKSLIIGLFRV